MKIDEGQPKQNPTKRNEAFRVAKAKIARRNFFAETAQSPDQGALTAGIGPVALSAT
jgi:hypothetical protein